MPVKGGDIINDYQARLCLLGEFCLDFAQIEGALHLAVYYLTGIQEPQFRALFSGLRAEAAMQSVRRLLEATEASQEKRDAYNEVFLHLKFILDARNLILHYGETFDLDTKQFFASNGRIAMSQSRLKAVPLSAEVLQQLIDDTRKALGMLLLLIFPAATTSMRDATLQKPWTYKPLSQSAPG